MLEAIGRLRASALDEQKVRVNKAIERGLQAAVVDRGYGGAVYGGFVETTYSGGEGAQQGIGEIASQDRADLRDFARFAEPVEPRRERLLKRRRDRL